MADDDFTPFPRIGSTRRTRLSDWVTLVENRVLAATDDAGAVYHSFDSADYVSILALTADGRVPLVHQFRPAVNRMTLEFPGGLLDPNETPERCAVRELAEEAGMAASATVPLGVFMPDSGRMGNRMWAFFAPDVTPISDWVAEDGVVPVTLRLDELYDQVCDGSFDHGPHLAMLGMALLRGLLQPPAASDRSTIALTRQRWRSSIRLSKERTQRDDF